MSDYDESQENEDYNDPDITPEMLEKLSALREERTVMDIDLEEQTKKLLREHGPRAAMNIVHMANNANNENVKLNANKYILDKILDPEGDAGKGIMEGILGDLVKSAETIANGGSI